MLGGDCPSGVSAQPLREGLRSTFLAPAGEGKARVCNSKTRRQPERGPEAAPGKEEGNCAIRTYPLLAGRQGREQEEALACALPSREEWEDLCLFSLVSAVEILLCYWEQSAPSRIRPCPG